MNRAHGLLPLGAILLLGLSGTGGNTAARLTVREGAADVHLLLSSSAYSWLPFEEFADCGDCHPTPCTAGTHWFAGRSGGPHRAYGEPDHGCQSGWCVNAHPVSETCGGETFSSLDPVDRERVRSRLAAGQLVSQNGIEEEYVGILTFNSTRSAWQATDCQGGIVLSIPALSTEVSDSR